MIYLIGIIGVFFVCHIILSHTSMHFAKRCICGKYPKLYRCNGYYYKCVCGRETEICDTLTEARLIWNRRELI